MYISILILFAYGSPVSNTAPSSDSIKVHSSLISSAVVVVIVVGVVVVVRLVGLVDVVDTVGVEDVVVIGQPDVSSGISQE